ncbi:MAG: membrane protein insertion efficiency factor YidD [Oscillatoriales cyanobacterium C42_A2020_001]|nr:membrane protein insertion efficiency factor YidD [Leptolyngbyaceae cyanobacterium C42_A2020_001]
MTVSTLDSLTRKTASGLINFYQRQILPHKGFSCAYRVLHQQESCSQYTKRTIAEMGLIAALPFIRERFQACKMANEVLKHRRQHWRNRDLHSLQAEIALSSGQSSKLQKRVAPAEEERSRSSCRDSVCDSFECLDTFSDGCDAIQDCISFDPSDFDCSDISCGLSDCSTFDCSALDCGSLDCGSCDFGGCSS